MNHVPRCKQLKKCLVLHMAVFSLFFVFCFFCVFFLNELELEMRSASEAMIKGSY